jgi:hypothetical protein
VGIKVKNLGDSCICYFSGCRFNSKTKNSKANSICEFAFEVLFVAY